MTSDKPRWRTRLDTPAARRYGGRGHMVVFRHRDDDGDPYRSFVSIEIPETPEPLITEALQVARAIKGRIIVVSDTRDQAEAMATRITITCGQHQRVPYERAVARAFGPVN
jgi:hypothetical protein